MKIEFILKDKNGIELQEGDRVNWCCENIPIEDCLMFGCINKMWNSGEIIPGQLIFWRTREQAVGYSQLQLVFVSDDGEVIWTIECPSELEDYRHSRLERM